MDDLKDYAGFIAVCISIGSTFWMWLTAGSRSNTEELRKVGETLDDHDRRIQGVEQEIRHMPDRETVHRLELTMKDMQAQIAAMAASAEATERTARRVEQFLIDRANKVS